MGARRDEWAAAMEPPSTAWTAGASAGASSWPHSYLAAITAAAAAAAAAAPAATFSHTVYGSGMVAAYPDDEGDVYHQHGDGLDALGALRHPLSTFRTHADQPEPAAPPMPAFTPASEDAWEGYGAHASSSAMRLGAWHGGGGGGGGEGHGRGRAGADGSSPLWTTTGATSTASPSLRWYHASVVGPPTGSLALASPRTYATDEGSQDVGPDGVDDRMSGFEPPEGLLPSVYLPTSSQHSQAHIEGSSSTSAYDAPSHAHQHAVPALPQHHGVPPTVFDVTSPRRVAPLALPTHSFVLRSPRTRHRLSGGRSSSVGERQLGDGQMMGQAISPSGGNESLDEPGAGPSYSQRAWRFQQDVQASSTAEAQPTASTQASQAIQLAGDEQGEHSGGKETHPVTLLKRVASPSAPPSAPDDANTSSGPAQKKPRIEAQNEEIQPDDPVARHGPDMQTGGNDPDADLDAAGDTDTEYEAPATTTMPAASCLTQLAGQDGVAVAENSAPSPAMRLDVPADNLEAVGLEPHPAAAQAAIEQGEVDANQHEQEPHRRSHLPVSATRSTVQLAPIPSQGTELLALSAAWAPSRFDQSYDASASSVNNAAATREKTYEEENHARLPSASDSLGTTTSEAPHLPSAQLDEMKTSSPVSDGSGSRVLAAEVLASLKALQTLSAPLSTPELREETTEGVPPEVDASAGVAKQAPTDADADAPPQTPKPAHQGISKTQTENKQNPYPDEPSPLPTSSSCASPLTPLASPSTKPASQQASTSTQHAEASPSTSIASDRTTLPTAEPTPEQAEMLLSTKHRVFPSGVPIKPDLPLLYQRYPVPCLIPAALWEPIFGGTSADSFDDAVKEEAVRGTTAPEGTRCEDVPSLLNLYSPRYVRGEGQDKEALCPLCWENGKERFFKTRQSQYNYHMQYTHGVSSATGEPFAPPTQIRKAKRNKNSVRHGFKTSILEGKCHACNKFVAIENVKEGPVKIPEVVWWRHARACHKHREPMAGIGGTFVENEFYRRIKAHVDAQDK